MITTILWKSGETLPPISASRLIATLRARLYTGSIKFAWYGAPEPRIAALAKRPKGIGKTSEAAFEYTMAAATIAAAIIGTAPNIPETLNLRAGVAHNTAPKIATAAQFRIISVA